MESITPSPPTRRERQRTETTAQIKAAARELLVDAGPSAISLRAIARNMGMSAPGLYRYFPNLDALLTQLCADLYIELGAYMEGECAKLPETDLLGRLLAAARGFRSWAVTNRAEFTLMFASLAPGTVIAGPGCSAANLDADTEPYRSMLAFSKIFGRMFDQIYRQSDAERGYAILTPAIPPLTPQLRSEILRCAYAIDAQVPVEFAYAFNSFWIRLYGLVAMEVFGQLPVVEQAEAMLEAELFDMAAKLGVALDSPPSDVPEHEE